MKNFIKYKIAVCFLLLMSVACDQDQDVSPIQDPATKPLISIARTDGGSNTLVEGDVLEYTITTDKMMAKEMVFSLVVNGGEVDETDFLIEGGVLAPYTTSTTMTVTVLADDVPELGEDAELTIEATDYATNWRLNPAAETAEMSTSVANVNMDGVVSIALSWPNPEDDLDFYIFTSGGSNWGGGASAGSTNPEVNLNLWPEDPNGDYYVEMDPFHLEGTSTPYKLSLGLPDGSVQFIEGVFDTANAESWETGPGGYRLLKVTVLDGAVTFTNLAP